MNRFMAIGTRIKENYENRYKLKLIRRIPVILRLDGKAFHTLTRKCEKPFDINIHSIMRDMALILCSEIQGAKCAYIQSDEVSILLTDFDRLNTEAWFDYNLQKITSVSAGIASAYFTRRWNSKQLAIFDSRAFNIPKEEICNYFIWRQQDWFRNSIQMLAQTHYLQKELQNKNTSDLHDMLHEKDVNWNDLFPIWKNGTFLCKEDCGWKTDSNIILTKQREIIERYIYI